MYYVELYKHRFVNKLVLIVNIPAVKNNKFVYYLYLLSFSHQGCYVAKL